MILISQSPESEVGSLAHNLGFVNEEPVIIELPDNFLCEITRLHFFVQVTLPCGFKASLQRLRSCLQSIMWPGISLVQG
jgi:hypothetical protein